MKAILSTFFAGLVLASLPAHAGTAIINLSVGGEISPGVYGQVQFGNAPPPPVLYAQPMIIVRQPPNVVVEPLYLHVPPGHERHWAKHCREYNACNRPVYFVKEGRYQPDTRSRENQGHRNENRGDHGDRGRGHGRGDNGDHGDRGGRGDRGD